MNLNKPESPEGDWQYAGENLRRHKTSGIYYVFAKRDGKQFRRSLETTDKAFARRKKDDFMREIERLAGADAAQVNFDELGARWLESERYRLKDSTVKRHELSLKSVSPFLLGLLVRNIRPRHCEAWQIDRGNTVAPQTFAHELETMRAIFRYAKRQGLILHDPSDGIKRPRIVAKLPSVPSREQFQNIVVAIRSESQGKGNNGADLVQLLAYSGMRLNEARSLRWRDVNFSRGVFTVTGGEHGTKNYEQRTVPVSDDMHRLLRRLKRKRGKVAPDALVIKTTSARKCMETACRSLGLSKFHHHSLRHYFATCAIESGVDIPTVAHWLGHKDGGALLMKTYSHLQQAHSLEQIKRVNFGVTPRAEAKPISLGNPDEKSTNPV
ncbi:MAG: tyrosine-type recombinase/integrase [Verrucomicrobiia bacterium]